MKAIVQDKYGKPEAVLTVREIAKPTVEDGEVLVRVHAASIHVGDWLVVTGAPFIARPAYGKPKGRVPGTDIAGTVEAVGTGVTDLKPGDEVFGWCTGAFAEYACAPADHFVLKPTNLTLEQASAVGVSASTALQLLRDQGKIQPGQKVLINGASGGIGTFAVQIAKAFGAEVTAVCSTKNAEMVRSIGADHVMRVLTSTGRLQSNNGTAGGRWFGTMGTVIKTAAVSMFDKRQLGPHIKFVNRKDHEVLKGLIEEGKVKPVIDTTYPLSASPEAIGHIGEGHARGTVVITVNGAHHA